MLDFPAIESVNINSLQNIFYQAADFTQFLGIAMRQATYILYLPIHVSSDRAGAFQQVWQKDHL